MDCGIVEMRFNRSRSRGRRKRFHEGARRRDCTTVSLRSLEAGIVGEHGGEALEASVVRAVKAGMAERRGWLARRPRDPTALQRRRLCFWSSWSRLRLYAGRLERIGVLERVEVGKWVTAVYERWGWRWLATCFGSRSNVLSRVYGVLLSEELRAGQSVGQ